MRIAIIGAGNVGGALGAAFSSAGHEVVFGVRDPSSEKVGAAVAGAKGSRATSPDEAVAGADVVLIALRWDAVAETVASLPSLEGRIVIDAMNRLAGVSTRSSTQDLADLLPAARVVKAFNTTGFENMTTARDRRTKAAMFVAGDDAEAKRVAMGLATDIGFEPYDAGPLENAKVLEDMVKVWLAMTREHGRRIAYSITND
jgi:predicted dinucleotide-binding enzyme